MRIVLMIVVMAAVVMAAVVMAAVVMAAVVMATVIMSAIVLAAVVLAAILRRCVAILRRREEVAFRRPHQRRDGRQLAARIAPSRARRHWGERIALADQASELDQRIGRRPAPIRRRLVPIARIGRPRKEWALGPRE